VKSKQQQRKESESELEERLNFKRLSVPPFSLSLFSQQNDEHDAKQQQQQQQQ
jgi:hypothetical protein